MAETIGEYYKVMITGKITDIKNAISEIETEISERRDIDSKVLGEIQAEIQEVKNKVLEVEQFAGVEQSHHVFPRVDVLVKEMVDLEGQKRFERVSCWRDLTMLRKELRGYMRELNDLCRKSKMVNNDSS